MNSRDPEGPFCKIMMAAKHTSLLASPWSAVGSRSRTAPSPFSTHLPARADPALGLRAPNSAANAGARAFGSRSGGGGRWRGMVTVDGSRACQAAEGAWRITADMERGRALLTFSPPLFCSRVMALERGSGLLGAGAVDAAERRRGGWWMRVRHSW